MKLLLVAGSYPPMRCGVGDYTARLAEALASMPDMTVAVLTSVQANNADSRIELLPIEDWTLRELPRLLKAVRRWRPDIVHFQFPTQGYAGRWLPWLLPVILRILGYCIVETWHEFPRRWHGWYSLNAALTRGIIVVRPGYKEKLSFLSRQALGRKPFRWISGAASIPPRFVTQVERDSIRDRFHIGVKQIVVFFGFIYPHKGVERLFQIADPERHFIILIGELSDADSYHRKILGEMRGDRWKDSAASTGYLPPSDVALILAAAGAAVFPFHSGGGEWNSSIHAAATQGAFILTTSDPSKGYIANENTYYARSRDVDEMREALDRYIGTRATQENIERHSDWNSIAWEHVKLYHEAQAYFAARP